MSARSQFRTDRSVVPLLLSNLLTMVWALIEEWHALDVMLVYWVQSVVIGYFNYHRILDLKEFSTANFTINNKQPDSTPATQKRVALFFALHYGGFHAVYLAFILGGSIGTITLSSFGVIVCIVAFVFNHHYSYQYNKERDSQRVPNIGTIMFFPYARILPMHLTIALASSIGGNTGSRLMVFLVIKTVADIIMHMVEHADARQKNRD